MTGANAGAVVAVEMLIEQQAVAPMGVLLELADAPEHGPVAMLVALEDVDHPVGDLFGDLVRISDLAVRSHQAETRAKAFCILAQRLHDQVSGGEPDGTAPVGVAAFQFNVLFSRLIADYARPECERMIFVVL